MESIVITVLGLALLLFAGVLHVTRMHRVFVRTNAMGVEYFESYTAKVAARTVDLLLKFGSLLLFAAGVLILANENVETWGWLIIAPALAFVLFILIGS
jgi:hypothetical protein